MSPGPKPIGSVLSELMARRGYARVRSAEAYALAWRDAVAPVVPRAAESTRVGPLRRATLEVIVANSTLVQELVFQKPTLLKALTRLLPDERIENLRFRVGAIDP